MAGSYLHAVNDAGELYGPEHLAFDTPGDVYEAVEEFYGMVWFLAGGDPSKVEEARRNYESGLAMSPGVDGMPDEDPFS